MKRKLSTPTLNALTASGKAYEVYDTQDTGFCVIVRPSGVKSFCVRYRTPEGQKRVYTIGKYGKFTVKQARDAAKKLLGQVNNGIDVQEAKRTKKADFERKKQQSLKIFFEERYQPYLLSQMKSGKSRVYVIRHYFVDQWGDKSLSDINGWLVTSWRNSQIKRGLSPAGVNRPISALKAMLQRAVEWNLIDENPLSSVKPLREDPNPMVRYLTDEEERRLLEALVARQDWQRQERVSHNQWLRDRGQPLLPILDSEFTDYLMPLIILALNTGMRRGELFDLEFSDVDMAKSRVVVRGQIAKSGKTRHIPLNTSAHSALQRWFKFTGERTGLIFSSPVTGRRFNNINTAWSNLMERAEIGEFRFHDLRHTFASKLAMRGVDLYTVKELLGHSSIETTQRYAHLAPEHKQKAVELL